VHVLQELRAQGSTVVIVTHRQGILTAADRVVLLRNGQVERDGPRDAVLAAMRGASATSAAGAPSPRLLAL